jgi:dTDP-4-amino-4,6-dideoxygalactose transaminase
MYLRRTVAREKNITEITVMSIMSKQTMINLSQPVISTKEKQAVLHVLSSGQLAQGAYVHEFEEEFAQYIGTGYAVATSSGTTALYLCLLALGIGRGDEVITTPFSFIASSNAILYTGARPVFVDIDETTYNLNPDLIRKKIGKKTKAILPVHLFGLPANMPVISRIAKHYGLSVVEDACQAHGASINKQKAGTFGDAAAFSFYPTKNMTTGEGGMITTNNKKLADTLRLLRNHGMRKRYIHDVLGFNFRMGEINAALGINQLPKLDMFNNKRQKNAATLSKYLSEVKELHLPHVPGNYVHVFHQYTVMLGRDSGKRRDILTQELLQKGIMTGIYYPEPIYTQKIYRQLGYRERLPVAERVASTVFSLPVHPKILKRQLQYIAESVKECLV